MDQEELEPFTMEEYEQAMDWWVRFYRVLIKLGLASKPGQSA